MSSLQGTFSPKWPKLKRMSLQINDHVLFFGDSITDCGRNRDALPGEAGGWGRGYVGQIATNLREKFPEKNLLFTNKGISGNRVYDLEDRLETEVLPLAPDIVTILIGINDVWRRYDSDLISDPDDFEASYRRILERIAASGAEMVLMEPFALEVPPVQAHWRDDLDPKIEVVRALAVEFGTKLIPLDGLFRNAARSRDAKFWLPDGVHPSPEGHALIASAWMDAMNV